MKAAIALVILAGLRIAHAQDVPSTTITHRVRQGDTLELIAAEVYGDRSKAAFIIAENRLGRPRQLKPGERLRLPISREVATSPGDTFESLAGSYLGSTLRAPFLAEYNAIAVDDNLPAGTLLTIPMMVVHTAPATESLADVAREYLGDSKQAELLSRYNVLAKGKRTLDKNESLLVPALHVRVAAARQPALDPASKARRDRRREASARAAKAVPAARQAWKDGDYAAVKAALTDLEPDLDYLDSDDAVGIGMLLGEAHIAFAEADLALATFKHVIDRQPRHVVRKYDCSPKVLAVWQNAGGQVE